MSNVNRSREAVQRPARSLGALARQVATMSRKGRLSLGDTVISAMEAHHLPTNVSEAGRDLEPIHPGSGRGDHARVPRGKARGNPSGGGRIGAGLAAVGLL